MKIISKFLIVVSIAHFSVADWAADFFSRSSCEYDGNGTAYSCAAGPGQAGAWNDLKQNAGRSIVAGDTWYICGTFGPEHARLSAPAGQMIVIFDSGDDGNPITIDGNCSTFGGMNTAILDGQGDYPDDGGIRHGVNIEDSSNVTVQNLDIRNMFGDRQNGNGISSRWSSNARNLIIRNNRVSNVRTQCIDIGGENYLLDGNYLELCGNDGIYISNGTSGGTPMAAEGTAYGTVSNNTLDRVSENGNDSGDGIKIQSCTNEIGTQYCSVRITGNTVYKTGTNKGAINVFGAGNGAIIIGNNVYGHEKDGNDVVEASDTGIGLDGCGFGATCYITGNYVEGFNSDGIVISGVLVDTADGDVFVTSNIIENLEGASVCGIDIQVNVTAGLHILNNKIGRGGDVACGVGSNDRGKGNPIIIRNNRISAWNTNFYVTDNTLPSWNSDYNVFDGNTTWNFTQSKNIYYLEEWMNTFNLDNKSKESAFCLWCN